MKKSTLLLLLLLPVVLLSSCAGRNDWGGREITAAGLGSAALNLVNFSASKEGGAVCGSADVFGFGVKACLSVVTPEPTVDELEALERELLLDHLHALEVERAAAAYVPPPK